MSTELLSVEVAAKLIHRKPQNLRKDIRDGNVALDLQSESIATSTQIHSSVLPDIQVKTLKGKKKNVK